MPALPSLHALRVFESVARLAHLGTASAELHITTGAVSHQLRLLQEQLGVALFEKKGRRLQLTDRGEHLQRCVARGLVNIGEGVRDVQNGRILEVSETTLKLSLPPTLSATWLSPRLFGFLAEHRHIRLRVDGRCCMKRIGGGFRSLMLAYVVSTLTRTDFGRGVCSMRLRTPHPSLTSVFWLVNLRDLSFGPFVDL